MKNNKKKCVEPTGKQSSENKSTPKALSLPMGVVDESAYRQYTEIRDSKTLKNVEAQTSDPNVSVNLRATDYVIKKKISHLPKAEQEELLGRASVLRKLTGKMVGFKRKAFNIKNKGSYSMQESLLDSKSAELVEYFGRFFSAKEVHRIVTLEWGMEVNLNTIDAFRKRNMEVVTARQEEYKRDFSDVRLGHKRSRLDELQYLYNHRKAKYESSGSKDDYKLLLTTIDQIRKEVEGDKLTIDGNIQMDVEHTVNMHIQQEVLKTVVINDIVVGRLAAKLGVDSRLLINKLHNSYYSKFTGFDPTKELAEELPMYPSKFVYNFDELQAQQAVLAEKSKQEKASLPVLPPTKSQEMSDIKSLLAKRIKAKQKQISESENRVNRQ